MSATLLTPRQSVAAMIEAGADFIIAQPGTITERYSYRIRVGGDAQRCHELMTAVKKRPKPFVRAFYAEVYAVTARARA